MHGSPMHVAQPRNSTPCSSPPILQVLQAGLLTELWQSGPRQAQRGWVIGVNAIGGVVSFVFQAVSYVKELGTSFFATLAMRLLPVTIYQSLVAWWTNAATAVDVRLATNQAVANLVPDVQVGKSGWACPAHRSGASRT